MQILYHKYFSQAVHSDIKRYLFNFQENNSHRIIAVSLDRLNVKNYTCEICNCQYPDFTDENIKRRWMTTKITSKVREYAEFGNELKLKVEEFDQVVSGINKRTPTGNCYAHNFSRNYTPHNFCTNSCAFRFSAKEDLMILVTRVDTKGKIGYILPETEEFNLNLGNKNLHRPSFMN